MNIPIKNLEPNNKYIIWFDIKGKAKTNDNAMKKVVENIFRNAYKLRDKIELEQILYSPSYSDRKEIGIKIFVKPVNISEKGLSALPLAIIGISTLVGTLIGGLTTALGFKKIEKITPAIKETRSSIQWIVIGILSIMIIPTLLNVIQPKKSN